MEFPTPKKIEADAYNVGLTMTEVCRRANVSRRAWERWKHGHTTLRIRAIEKLLTEIESAARIRGERP